MKSKYEDCVYEALPQHRTTEERKMFKEARSKRWSCYVHIPWNPILIRTIKEYVGQYSLRVTYCLLYYNIIKLKTKHNSVVAQRQEYYCQKHSSHIVPVQEITAVWYFSRPDTTSILVNVCEKDCLEPALDHRILLPENFHTLANYFAIAMEPLLQKEYELTVLSVAKTLFCT